MGLIKAALGAAGGVMADQWKEYFYCESIPENVMAVKGQRRVSGRSSNTKGSENIISNGSVVAVADGQCMIIVDQGKVTELCAVPGEFVYDSSTEPTIFSGELGTSILDNVQKYRQTLYFGGEPPKDQRVYYFNTKELIGNKYGTPSPVPFRVVDQRAGIDIDIAIRCFGEYSYRISDPILFYTNVCGNVSEDYTRDRLDGQLKTGRDIVLMAMLGAEEYGFATAALIVLGCVMMRKCNQNTCPVGVATQNPELRRRFTGRSEYLVNYFTFLACEVREYLAEIGVEKMDDIIGRTDLIIRKPDDGIRKHQLINFDKVLARVDNEAALRHVTDQQHGIEHVKDVEMLHAAADAVNEQKEVSLEYTIANTDRACGAMLSGAIAAKYGAKGLPEHTLNVKFKGSAGQSFGAFLVPGVNFKLEGEANDYLGKGLSGGRIAVLPPVRSNFEAEKNTIAGNTLLYGATGGEVYINGRAGERFAVRNSGATAVVEGVGDHCCEYMTGGRVVVLGQTGRNFAAGMSGGVAYVWNKDGNFDYFCNMEMVELSLIEEASYRKELHELIRQHYLYTGSKLARILLDDWMHYVDQFIQVVPIEYKKVAAGGTDEEAATEDCGYAERLLKQKKKNHFLVSIFKYSIYQSWVIQKHF